MSRDSKGRFIAGSGGGGSSERTVGQGVSMSFALDASDVLRRLEELAKKAGALDPLLDEIGASQVAETQERFELHRGPDGRPWKEHAKATLELRKKKGATSPQLLRDQGDLYDSLTHKVGGGAVRWGSDRIYARIHQLGGQAGRGRKTRIEARPYLGISEQGKREIASIITDYIGRAA